jgi:thiaminase (transcriptional activator TenA)
MWGYSEVGQRLSRRSRPSDARYARWIDMYADPEFAALAEWCREVCDEIGLADRAQTRDRMHAAFLSSSRHELAFWDAAWTPRDGRVANDHSP